MINLLDARGSRISHRNHVVRRAGTIHPLGPRVLDARFRRHRLGLTRLALAIVGGARVRYTLQLSGSGASGFMKRACVNS